MDIKNMFARICIFFLSLIHAGHPVAAYARCRVEAMRRLFFFSRPFTRKILKITKIDARRFLCDARMTSGDVPRIDGSFFGRPADGKRRQKAAARIEFARLRAKRLLARRCSGRLSLLVLNRGNDDSHASCVPDNAR